MNKAFLIVLVILNLMVLLGQILPEAAPPFARIVNIATMILNLLLLISLFRNKGISQNEK